MPIQGTLTKNLHIKTEGKLIKKLLVQHDILKKSLADDIKATMAEAEQRRKDFEKEGYDKGFRQGLKNGLEALFVMEVVKQELLLKLDSHICEIVKNISKEVLSEALSTQEGSILGRIKRAVNAFLNHSSGSGKGISVHVSPEDYETLIDSDYFNNKNLCCVSDSRVSKGDAILHTPSGEIEIKPGKHLDHILLHLSRMQLVPEETLEACDHKVKLVLRPISFCTCKNTENSSGLVPSDTSKSENFRVEALVIQDAA